ncbi:MAG: hypothetical protein QOF76_500 [Solirubrobacteraceae bacterium]|nr:hypothetical protein [Solirubrobacteraceae bacterium]
MAVPDRVRLVVIGFLACGFAALAAVWIATLTKGDDAGAESSATTPYTGNVRPPGVRVPEFSLRDQDGKLASPPRGTVAIYAFIYTHCKDDCPLEVAQIRSALDELGHDVPVFGISVDPANDTPASARSFLIKQKMTLRMRFLLGSERELAPIWKAFATLPQTPEKEHPAVLVVGDAKGEQKLSYFLSQLTGSGLAADLKLLGA